MSEITKFLSNVSDINLIVVSENIIKNRPKIKVIIFILR